MSSIPEQLYFCLPHQLVQDLCLHFWWFPVWQWWGDHKSASSHQHWHPCGSLRFGNTPAIRRWTFHEILKCLLTTCAVLPYKVPSPFIFQYLSKQHVWGNIEWYYRARTWHHLGYRNSFPVPGPISRNWFGTDRSASVSPSQGELVLQRRNEWVKGRFRGCKFDGCQLSLAWGKKVSSAVTQRAVVHTLRQAHR